MATKRSAVKLSPVPLAQAKKVHRSSANSPKGQLRDGKFEISHCEFVDTVSFTAPSTNAGNFTLIGSSALTPGYDLTPANDLVFPWLSSQAINWELYQFNRVKFILAPKQAATASGWVSMAFDYDYADNVSSTKREMLTNMTVVEGSVFAELSLSVDTNALNRVHKTRYIQSTGPTSLDPRQIYGGYLEVAIDGASASTSYSWDLWVEYDVILSIPRSSYETVESQVTGSGKVVASKTGEMQVSIPLPVDIGVLGQVLTNATQFPTLAPITGFDAGTWSSPSSIIKTTNDQLSTMLGHLESNITLDTSATRGITLTHLWDAAGAYKGYMTDNGAASTSASSTTKTIVNQFLGSIAAKSLPYAIAYALPVVKTLVSGTLGAAVDGTTKFRRMQPTAGTRL